MMKTLDTQRQKHLLLDNLSLVCVMATRLDFHIYVYVYAYPCFLSAYCCLDVFLLGGLIIFIQHFELYLP